MKTFCNVQTHTSHESRRKRRVALRKHFSALGLLASRAFGFNFQPPRSPLTTAWKLIPDQPSPVISHRKREILRRSLSSAPWS